MSQDCNTFGICWSEVWSWLSHEASSSSWLGSRGGLPRVRGVKIFPFEVNQIIWTFLTSTLRLLGLIQWHMVTLKDLQHPYQSCLSGFNMYEFSPAIFPYSWWRYQIPVQLWWFLQKFPKAAAAVAVPGELKDQGTVCSQGDGRAWAGSLQWHPGAHRWHGKFILHLFAALCAFQTCRLLTKYQGENLRIALRAL